MGTMKAGGRLKIGGKEHHFSVIKPQSCCHIACTRFSPDTVDNCVGKLSETACRPYCSGPFLDWLKNNQYKKIFYKQ